MGTGALRDGTDFNGACRFRTVNWLKDYKPGKIYAFRVMSSIKLGFKIKLVPEDETQETDSYGTRSEGKGPENVR